jgi:hypothetical protein
LWIAPERGVWVVVLSNRSFNVKEPPSLEDLREDVFLDAAGLEADDGRDDDTASGAHKR